MLEVCQVSYQNPSPEYVVYAAIKKSVDFFRQSTLSGFKFN
jgi:hypothetical protein